MSERTPGRWSAVFGEDSGYDCMTHAWHIRADGDRSLADIDLGDYGQGRNQSDFTSAEAEANARLFAAAPDLLAALSATMDLWGSNAPHDFDVCEDVACGCIRQRARAAIARAEGREL